MKTGPILALMIGWFMVAAKPAVCATKSDTSNIHGVWRVVSAELQGKELDRGKLTDAKIIIVCNRLIVKRNDAVKSDQAFRLEPTKNPKAIDITATVYRTTRVTSTTGGSSTPEERTAISTKVTEMMFGIYALDGDTLRLCLGAPGSKNRPTQFTTRSGPGFQMLILKRDQP